MDCAEIINDEHLSWVDYSAHTNQYDEEHRAVRLPVDTFFRWWGALVIAVKGN